MYVNTCSIYSVNIYKYGYAKYSIYKRYRYTTKGTFRMHNVK